MKGYKEIPADRMPGNVIEMIGRQWMLVTAGSGGAVQYHDGPGAVSV